MIDFNAMSTSLVLFYALQLSKHKHCLDLDFFGSFISDLHMVIWYQIFSKEINLQPDVSDP